MAENYLLGMDMGTTNIKANIMDTKGNVIATASRPSHLIFPAANQIEQDANEWWDNAKAVFKENNNNRWQRDRDHRLTHRRQRPFGIGNW